MAHLTYIFAIYSLVFLYKSNQLDHSILIVLINNNPAPNKDIIRVDYKDKISFKISDNTEINIDRIKLKYTGWQGMHTQLGRKDFGYDKQEEVLAENINKKSLETINIDLSFKPITAGTNFIISVEGIKGNKISKDIAFTFYLKR
ncbi:hypothetical protein [Spirosoma aerolatum]|uniref:hypothetical protein n=1 Tax=Spirosoma aerolatum TaxID=1211326 RepID=UPI0009AE0FFB|nr:hypothetical protein [Spirosoma aerolatum]